MKLVLYQTPTPTLTQPPPTPVAAIPVTPSPTPTPFTHTIVKGDTLLILAFKYGVSREEIEAANTGVNPNLLVVGETLVIPIVEEIQTSAPEATPLPVSMDTPVCYREASGGAWCFVLVENTQEVPLENLSAVFGLFTEEAENSRSEVGLAPLNLLAPGGKIPLMAYFPPPVPSQFSTRAELLTSLPAENNSDRYLPVELQALQTIIAENRKHASITGEVSLVAHGEVLSYLWIAAVAYDQEGRVVGIRLWKAEQSCSSAFPGSPMGVSPTPGEASIPEPPPAGLPAECLVFQFSIFSMGPDIERVEVYAEARP